MAKQPFSCNRRNSLRLPSTDGMISLSRKARTLKSEKLAFYSRSYLALIRVYDEAGNVTVTHEHACDFKEW
jgi:hypothetical protein